MTTSFSTAAPGVSPASAGAAAPVAAPPTVAFKDWALLCEALGGGRQSLLLRKGGLVEGRAGFQFKHAEFALFPTQYHEQAAKIRPAERPGLQAAAGGPPDPAAEPALVPIRYVFRLEWTRYEEDWAAVARLEPFHVYTEEVIRERFHYEEKRGAGLWVAFGRVFRLEPAWNLPDRPAYGGCRSWLENLPPWPAGSVQVPVLDEASHRRRDRAVREALGPGSGPGGADPGSAALAGTGTTRTTETTRR